MPSSSGVPGEGVGVGGGGGRGRRKEGESVHTVAMTDRYVEQWVPWDSSNIHDRD